MKLQTTSTLNASVLAAFLPSDRHDALFVVGSLDETLELRGLRYHPIDIETSVSRAHRSIAERWHHLFVLICTFLVSLYLTWLLFIWWGQCALIEISAKGIIIKMPEVGQSLDFILPFPRQVSQKAYMQNTITNGSNMEKSYIKDKSRITWKLKLHRKIEKTKRLLMRAGLACFYSHCLKVFSKVALMSQSLTWAGSVFQDCVPLIDATIWPLHFHFSVSLPLNTCNFLPSMQSYWTDIKAYWLQSYLIVAKESKLNWMRGVRFPTKFRI